jgi:GDP-mannose 6-dehydrogenase
MRISIFGLGYVGAVSSACLASEGHTVIGVDPQQVKLDLINSGQTPIIEKDLDTLVKKAVQEGRLSAINNAAKAIENTEISIICVGTPSQSNGDLDLSYLRKVCEEIGIALKNKPQKHVVVIRSTIFPGTMKNVVIPTLEKFSGKIAGSGFGLCNNPEFLREGTAVYDFFNPPKTVIGQLDQESADVLASIYLKIKAPLIRADIETVEMVKYVDNAWHALKVSFGNEIGNFCKVLGIDGYKLMEIFCKDTKLNLSPYYLKPGFAFGGSCLPKDLRALSNKARTMSLELPILNAIIPSNELQIAHAIQMITGQGNKKVGILGLSFKPGTDDLRESPMTELVERLIGKGYDIRIYDRNVSLSFLMGANRDYLLKHIPHISQLIVKTIDEVIAHAETMVIGNNDPEFKEVIGMVKPNQVIVDLVRIVDHRSKGVRYDGICW